MELDAFNILIVLLAAWTGGLLAKRLGYPMVLGELIAGVVLGPPLLGLLGPDPGVAMLGQIGVLLMMFYIGLKMQPSELREASWGGLLAALGGFIVPLVICGGLMWWQGFSWMASLFVGVAAGVTSLATKSRILAELDLFNTRIAHVMMAGALVADTLCLIIFAALLGFATSGVVSGAAIAQVAFSAVGFFAFAWVMGRLVLPWVVTRSQLYKRLDRSGRFICGIAFALLLAEASHLAGLHGILGAFIAGLLLNEESLGKQQAQQLTERVGQLSLGFLAPFFFVTAGFAVDLDVVATHTWLVIAVITLATAGKVFGTAALYSLTGHGWREGITIGAGMNGRGAVEIIVAQLGLSMGIIDATVFSLLVIMAIATTATVPVLLRWATNWLRSRGELVIVRPVRQAAGLSDSLHSGSWSMPSPSAMRVK